MHDWLSKVFTEVDRGIESLVHHQYTYTGEKSARRFQPEDVQRMKQLSSSSISSPITPCPAPRTTSLQTITRTSGQEPQTPAQASSTSTIQSLYVRTVQ